MEVESTFNIRLSNPEVEQFRTVGDLFDIIVRKRAIPSDTTRGQGYVGPLWERYLDLVERSLGVPREALTPDAHFVKDLGAD